MWKKIKLKIIKLVILLGIAISLTTSPQVANEIDKMMRELSGVADEERKEKKEEKQTEERKKR